MSDENSSEYLPRPNQDIEDVRDYCTGGYHPVHICDIFNDRYQVVNKLGHGSYGMVWLVEDLHLKRFASLKILAADHSASSPEMRVAQHLKEAQERDDCHPGKEHVMRILDTFTIEGPNGTHHCIVAELLGISLLREREGLHHLYGNYVDHLPQKVNKQVAAQVALGLAYLHKCGIIHADLNIGNMLYHSPKLQQASLRDLDKIYGWPDQHPVLYSKDGSRVPPSDHRPNYVVASHHKQRLFKLCLVTDKIHVKISDFGESSIYEPQPRIEKPLQFYMPLVFQAPEILFDDINAPTFSMDIWSLGVLLFMIMHQKNPPFYRPFDPNAAAVVEKMVMYLGKPPEKWWTRWAKRSEYYNEDGVHVKKKVQAGTCGLKCLKADSDISEEEAAAFNGMLQKIFRYDPAERIDAEEVLKLIPNSWKEHESEESESDGNKKRWKWKGWSWRRK